MVLLKLCEYWYGPPSPRASLRNYRGDDHGSFQENKLHLQQHISVEFLKLQQFLHGKEKDILNELREEGKVLSEEMELNLNQLQEQYLLVKEMLVSIQARMEEQNSFNFLKVRLHIKMMGMLLGGKGSERISHNEGEKKPAMGWMEGGKGGNAVHL